MAHKALQPLNERPTLRAPGLLVMDADGTLFEQEVIDELGALAHVPDQVAAITARAMNGELDFAQALRERVRLLRGLPNSAIDGVRHGITITRGARTLVDTLHAHGWRVGVVSGGFHDVLDPIARDLGLDHVLAHRLQWHDGTLTGDIEGTVVDRDAKRDTLVAWAHLNGIDMAQTVAIGDGANDIAMLLTAGLGIGFDPKPAVRRAVPTILDERNLAAALDLLRR